LYRAQIQIRFNYEMQQSPRGRNDPYRNVGREVVNNKAYSHIWIAGHDFKLFVHAFATNKKTPS
jgi:hypothetical protein